MSNNIKPLSERRRLEKQRKFKEQRRRIYKKMSNEDLAKANIKWENLKVNESEIFENIVLVRNEVSRLVANKELQDNLGEKREEFESHRDSILEFLCDVSSRLETIIESRSVNEGHITNKVDLIKYEDILESYIDMSTEFVTMQMAHLNIMILIATQVAASNNKGEVNE